MAMAYIWVGAAVVSVLYGAATGSAAAVGNAAMKGAADAVTLCLSIGGMICLWSGILTVMERSGVTAALTRLLRPILSFLFPSAAKYKEVMEPLSENVSANLLGLGNAATPAGIRAASALLRREASGREFCRLVVMNTASIQLLPTTVAAVRAAAGAESAFDILPAVWITSFVSVAVGLAAERLFASVKR